MIILLGVIIILWAISLIFLAARLLDAKDPEDLLKKLKERGG